ncbi:hypothetical protein ACIOWI_25055 [Streptomyces sp. NPDC087659]|uniref:hypothetical protein n=1 Tax=Streptomyces sp. NPDC087659 TaxID=3365801 RepID=UPI003806028A
MGRRTSRSAPGGGTEPPEPSGASYDHGWAGERRAAIRCAALLLALLLLIDGSSGSLTLSRAAVWTGLAILLFVVLLPPRVTAGAGWLASRGLWRERRVLTDRLIAVRWSNGVARRVVLRDIEGGQVEVDPQVLVANPQLWRLLDAGARTSLGRGTLLCGATALRRLSRTIDGETAQSVFRISGLEQ